jgi:hypothetical protein
MGGATGGVRLRVRSCLWLVSAILIRSSRTINNLRDARAPADESPRQLHGGCLAPHLSWITGSADTPTSSDFCPGHAEQRWATSFAESSLCREYRTTIREYCSAALEATFGQNGLSASSRMLLTGRHERFCANLPYGRSKLASPCAGPAVPATTRSRLAGEKMEGPVRRKRKLPKWCLRADRMVRFKSASPPGDRTTRSTRPPGSGMMERRPSVARAVLSRCRCSHHAQRLADRRLNGQRASAEKGHSRASQIIKLTAH